MTRAVVALLHGHPIAAFALNPLVFLVVAFLGWSLRPGATGRRARRARSAGSGGGGALTLGVLGASLVVAVARNLV